MTYESKWLVTQGLPVILGVVVAVVLLLTRLVQFLQRVVFKVVPFGAVGDVNLIDVCIGVLITGSYYLYFRTWTVSACVAPAAPAAPAVLLWFLPPSLVPAPHDCLFPLRVMVCGVCCLHVQWWCGRP